MHFSVNYSQYIIPKANNKSRTDIFVVSTLHPYLGHNFGTLCQHPVYGWLFSRLYSRLSLSSLLILWLFQEYLLLYQFLWRERRAVPHPSAVCSGPALMELNLSWGHNVTLTHNCQTNALICQNSVSGKIIHNSSIPLSVCMCCWNVLWFLAWLGLCRNTQCCHCLDSIKCKRTLSNFGQHFTVFDYPIFLLIWGWWSCMCKNLKFDTVSLFWRS